MEIKNRIHEKDYIDFNRAHVLRWRRPGRVALLLILGFILSIFAMFYGVRYKDEFLSWIGPVLFTLPIGYVLLIIMMKFVSKREYKTNPFFTHEIYYTFDEHGFTAVSPISTTEINKQVITKVKESKDLLAIYISHHQAYLFPKDQMNPEVKSNLLNWLKTNLNESKLKGIFIS